METQDHKKVDQSGHDGHVGIHHVCHKCGWSFPNPHPSAKHRRAHKRVCGTIDGYRLNDDDDDDDDNDKTHLDDSDDDYKTPIKAVERSTSKKSNSGVGSISSRSMRSEDDVFTDAATDFVDNSSSEDAFGVMSRGNSLQNISEYELDGARLVGENSIDDDLAASNTLLEDKELRTNKTMKGENDKARITHIETAEGALRGQSEELKSSFFGGMVGPSGVQASGLEDKVEFSHFDSPKNFHVSVPSVKVVEDTEGYAKTAVPDAVAVEDLNHEGGKFNIPKATDATLSVESSLNAAANSDYSMENTLNQKLGQNKPEVEENTVREVNPISVVKGSSKELNDHNVGCSTKEQNVVDSVENFSPEVDSLSGIYNQEKTANEGANRNVNDEHGEEDFVVHVNARKDPLGEVTVSTVDDSALKGKEYNADNSNDIGYGEKIGVEDTPLNKNEVKIGEENNPGSVKFSSSSGSTVTEHEQMLDYILESGNMMVVHSQPEHLLNSPNNAEIPYADNQIANIVDNFDSNSEMIRDVGVDGECNEKFTDNACKITDGDKFTKQHARGVSAVEIVDSISQTESLEGNCGSISVEALREDQATENNTSDKPLVMPREMEVTPEASRTQQLLIPALQTGWSPTVADVAKESHGANRNEEIIAKVNNWNTEEHHNGAAKINKESPNLPAKAENLSRSFKEPKIEVDKEEIGNGWDSPARYPVKIETEKKRAKNKPYWATFLCCSSVNAR